ncbi:hypothetical protein RD055328_10940 [Companilactobacillus sp. RD055328]|uniref:TMEM175 family protein n=1 Tax=Companilactobacillus sp. RD055328 TaxID=2916634 RepID=UPI001FC85CBE|nr:TMEM175 family protein [Companilactobacillus sp. RD055328]GKQ43171.1 hypothetical protein RD055328_10940 [Companilactobacillus sp. RD055328]
MENIKNRLLAFSDGIIAIIITIMVLDLPLITHNTWDNAKEAILSIIIYFISFIFVANSWYKHALIFEQVDKLDSKSISFNFIYLMILSLMPYATKLMTSDLNKYTVLFYGLLYLLTSGIYRAMARYILHQKYDDKASMRKIYEKIYAYNDAAFMGGSIIGIILGFFFPVFSLIIFLGVPIIEFFHRHADRSDLDGIENISAEDKTEVSQLNMSQWRDFRKKWRETQRNLNLQHERNKLSPEELKKLQEASDTLLKKYNLPPMERAPRFIKSDNRILTSKMTKKQWHSFEKEWRAKQKSLGIPLSWNTKLTDEQIQQLRNEYSKLLSKYTTEIKKDA